MTQLPLVSLPAPLQAIVEAGRAQRGIADMTVEECRAFIAARTATRPRGPDVETVHDFEIPGPHVPVRARLYRPTRPLGTAVVFHGGGWLMGSLDSFDATSRYLARDSGLAIVSVDYRLAPESRFPAAVDDALAAVKWVVRNSEALDVDSRRIAVLGESAGGNLAAVVCLLAREEGLKAIQLQVLVYPSVDARLQTASLREFSAGPLQTTRDVERALHMYGLGSVVQAQDWRLSPLLAPSHADLPAALIISAGQDGVRDDSFAYAECLLRAGVEAAHVSYPQMVHTFFGMRGVVAEAEYAQTQAASAMRAAILRSAPR